MTARLRTSLLRGNAFYIGVAGALGLIFDIRGVLYGLGPQGQVLAGAPLAGIGFVEAHGLAVILAVLLMRAPSARSWHVTAAAMDLLLGVANLAFWQLFVVTDALAVGYVTTILHWSFGAAHVGAAFRTDRNIMHAHDHSSVPQPRYVA